MKLIGRPVTALELKETGPIIEVMLGPHPIVADKIWAAGGLVDGINVRLLIDTGADSTVVESSLAASLNIPPIRYTQMVGVSRKPELCPVYMMGICLSMRDDQDRERLSLFSAEFTGVASSLSPKFDGLLGRDFLSHVRFVYDGQNGKFEIERANETPSPVISALKEQPLSRQQRRLLQRKGK